MQIEAILRCPISGEDLQFVEASAIRAVRLRLVSELKHLDGTEVSPAFEGFLRNDTGDIYYPIYDGILILLPAFAILAPANLKLYRSRLTSADTMTVMRFYDQVGWKEAASGVFVDADTNEDFRNVSARYIHDCHMRVNKFLPKRGRYIVDVASGPVQYDEYLSYSQNFTQRICCDVSIEALRLAKARLGEKGVYIQCDITRMPLKDGAVDAFISLHTIFHVPADKQVKAFRELERITGKGGGGVVVYSWGGHSWAMKALSAPNRLVNFLTDRVRSIARLIVLKKLVAKIRRRSVAVPIAVGPIQQSASTFCFHAHTFRWYRENVASFGGWTVRPWRSLSVEYLQTQIPDNAMGRSILWVVYSFEEVFPATFGRIGQYPAFVFRKLEA